MERRGDLESGLPLEASEYGDRVRGLPLTDDGDLEGIIMSFFAECDRVVTENARLESLGFSRACGS